MKNKKSIKKELIIRITHRNEPSKIAIDNFNRKLDLFIKEKLNDTKYDTVN
jgi:hypothetical protein